MLRKIRNYASWRNSPWSWWNLNDLKRGRSHYIPFSFSSAPFEFQNKRSQVLSLGTLAKTDRSRSSILTSWPQIDFRIVGHSCWRRICSDQWLVWWKNEGRIVIVQISRTTSKLLEFGRTMKKSLGGNWVVHRSLNLKQYYLLTGRGKRKDEIR